MKKRWIVPIATLSLLAFVIVDCSKSSSPTQPTQQQMPPASQLSAVPPSVSVGPGGNLSVTIRGGKPPYNIETGPNGIASVSLAHADSTVATLLVSGISVATASTSVTIGDSGDVKSTTIPISVH